MADTFAYNILVTFILAISFCIATVSECAPNEGFSIELVHRDSPGSPYYNPSETPSQRVTKAVRRSIQRSNALHTASAADGGTSPVSTVLPDNGEYLMNISIGTPPFKIIATADTGSDLIWTQCQPCTDCFNQVNPIFDPRNSKTFQKLPCTSSACESNGGQASCDNDRSCSYHYSYGDGSFTNGNIAVDTVTLDTTSGGPVSFPKTVIGCGYNNEGLFDNQTSGIIGLGRGPISLISQMGNATGGTFSYCLVPFLEAKSSSKLNFGANAQVSGPGVVTTPLVQKQLAQKTFYFVTLEGISVGQTRIPFKSILPFTKGNMIVDSGTTLTLLPPELFGEVQAEIVKQVKLQQVDDPDDSLKLCFSSSSDQVPLPPITVHFEGADVTLASINTFLRITKDVLCFAMNPSASSWIFGNVAQMDFEVGYDITHGMLSFRPTDCTKE